MSQRRSYKYLIPSLGCLRTIYLCSYYFSLYGAFAVLAQDIDYEAAVRSIFAVIANPTFVPYTMPTQKIPEFIALGDFYTAGTGCNGQDKVLTGNALRGKHS